MELEKKKKEKERKEEMEEGRRTKERSPYRLSSRLKYS